MDREFITFGDAARILGCSIQNVPVILRRAQLATYHDPVDRRRKLVERAEVESLARRSAGAPRSNRKSEAARVQ